MPLTSQDFNEGVDMTGINPVTAADLNSLVQLANPVMDTADEGKGIVLCTRDSALGVPVVPNAAAITKWQRYLWLRIKHASDTDATPLVYAWDDTRAVLPIYAKWAQTGIDTANLAIDIAVIQADITNLQGDVITLTAVANAANTNANTANTNATTANGTANAAAANATTALANAATAQAAADAAQVTADTAISAALSAQTTAANALGVAANALTNSTIQTLEASTNAYATYATVIPLDDTIPQQSTEGSLLLSQAITPTAVGTIINITAYLPLTGISNGVTVIAALFVDAVEDALAAVSEASINNGDAHTIVLHYRYISVDTVAHTFKIHVGCNAGSVGVNGYLGRSFGGVSRASLCVQETRT